MKVLIRGEIYNTRKSEIIVFKSNEYKTEDERYTVEILYRTKLGKFFLFCTGGKESKYHNHKLIKSFKKMDVYNWLSWKGNIKAFQRLIKLEKDEKNIHELANRIMQIAV